MGRAPRVPRPSLSPHAGDAICDSQDYDQRSAHAHEDCGSLFVCLSVNTALLPA